MPVRQYINPQICRLIQSLAHISEKGKDNASYLNSSALIASYCFDSGHGDCGEKGAGASATTYGGQRGSDYTDDRTDS